MLASLLRLARLRKTKQRTGATEWQDSRGGKKQKQFDLDESEREARKFHLL